MTCEPGECLPAHAVQKTVFQLFVRGCRKVAGDDDLEECYRQMRWPSAFGSRAFASGGVVYGASQSFANQLVCLGDQAVP